MFNAVMCPLATKELLPDINDSERQCEVPETWTKYLQQYPGNACVKDGQCVLFHSEYAALARNEQHKIATTQERHRGNGARFDLVKAA